MGFCFRCGRQLDSTMRFCPGCGASNTAQPQPQPYQQTPPTNTWLCNYCGKRLDSTMRTCPDCGAVNPGNPQVMAQVASQVYAQNRAVKSFSIGFSVAALIVGILLFLIHMVLLTMDPPSYLIWEAFGGAASAAMIVVFSIIGLVKKEPVTKVILICGGVSLWALFMYVYLSF